MQLFPNVGRPSVAIMHGTGGVTVWKDVCERRRGAEEVRRGRWEYAIDKRRCLSQEKDLDYKECDRLEGLR